MSIAAPSPTRLLAAKTAFAAVAVTATTALTVSAVAPTVAHVARPSDTMVSATQTLTMAQVQLLASMGIYLVGPGAQIMRNLGMGTPQDVLNNAAGLAQLIPGDAGVQLKATIETIAAALAAAQAGINIPVVGNVGLPEISVPPMGPAGTIDQVAGLEDSGVTTALLSLVKTGLMNGDAVAVLIDAIGGAAGLDTDALTTLIADLPLNVPGTAGEVEVLNPLYPLSSDDQYISAGAFVSSADRFAIIPTWGLGGTSFALASPTFLNDPEFDTTAILAIALRNTSRPGGGLIALLNPLSQTVGLNLSNVDGTGTPEELIGGGIPPFVSADITKYDGNVTVWDITAAYDILSDAPSTIFSPLSWFNSGVGAVAPTYMIPANITDFATVLEDLTSGQIDIGTLNTLLGTVNSTIEMFNVNVGQDGNLYVTYNSGNLPLLEPIQFLPRTLSYVPGFNISTPVSSSFEDVLTQLVAQGYQDVNMTLDSEGVATFERGFDLAGSQAKFWQNPISWEMGMETPQTIFNSVITGLQDNLLDVEGNQFELFGNSEIGNLVYRNAASVAIAKALSDALEQVRDALNPLMNGAQDAFRPLAEALDKATLEVNKVIDNGLAEVSKLGVDLSGPMLDANRTVNEVGDGINNGIRGVLGLKPIESPAPFTPTAPAGEPESRSGGDMGPGALPKSAPNTIMVSTLDEPQTENQGAGEAQESAAEEVQVPQQENDAVTTPAKEEAPKDGGDVTSTPKRVTVKDRVDARVEKTERSLSRAAQRAENVNEKLRDGDLEGAAGEVRKNVTNRLDRLNKDVSNGTNKLRDALRGGAKKGNDASPSGGSSASAKGGSNGGSSSGGSDSGE